MRRTTPPQGRLTTAHAIHVHFHEPHAKGSDFYFGSLRAIYEMFTWCDVGIQIFQLYKHHLSHVGRRVATDKAVIESIDIHRIIHLKGKEV